MHNLSDALLARQYRLKLLNFEVQISDIYKILEPSQVYEVHSTLKAHIENMIILFHTVLVYVMHSFNPRRVRLISVPN
jgi:hypothetical protein